MSTTNSNSFINYDLYDTDASQAQSRNSYIYGVDFESLIYSNLMQLQDNNEFDEDEDHNEDSEVEIQIEDESNFKKGMTKKSQTPNKGKFTVYDRLMEYEQKKQKKIAEAKLQVKF